jgi:hypothetical protein
MSKFRMTRKESDRRRAARRDAQVKAMFPGEPPDNTDAFRFALARKLSMAVGDQQKSWRACREPACRRSRACMAPRNTCANFKPPRRPLTPDQEAGAMATLKRMLREKLDGRGEAER